MIVTVAIILPEVSCNYQIKNSCIGSSLIKTGYKRIFGDCREDGQISFSWEAIKKLVLVGV